MNEHLEQSTYLVSTRAKCIIFDFPLPIGSMRYRDASTTPLTPPKSKCASGCATDVSTMTHAPRGKSARHDLKIVMKFFVFRKDLQSECFLSLDFYLKTQ